MKKLTINTGLKIPIIGFGTWMLSNNEAAEAVIEALDIGYRLIDTAAVYGNESGVGEGITQSGLPREEIFVTTKLWNDDQGYESTIEAFNDSLHKLQLEYVDLYLIHWPATDQMRDSWEALEELHRKGLAKNIGVSNYTVRHLRDMKQYANIMPAVNQIEFHPFLYKEQRELLDYCVSEDIIVEAYSPLARARGLDNDTLNSIAKSHNKSVAQIMLRWAVQQLTIPIPKSSHPERILENFDIFDFELSKGDMELINRINIPLRTGSVPSLMP